ncbi:MAG: ABC transporter ATP-binding protein [Egibacteraceae bacterium]
MPELLRVEQIHKTFGSVTAVAGMDLRLDDGEFLAVIGRSGSGKSTLLNLLAGLETPDAGRIFYQGGEDIVGWDEDALAVWRREHVGLVFQAFHLITTLSALENVALPLYPERVSVDERRTRARAALEQVGLGHRLDHRPNQLSGGEQQRVAIARALIHDPRLLVADEPTGNLDSATGEQILALFQKLRSGSNLALIVATHDDKIAATADRVIRMVDGKVAS